MKRVYLLLVLLIFTILAGCAGKTQNLNVSSTANTVNTKNTGNVNKIVMKKNETVNSKNKFTFSKLTNDQRINDHTQKQREIKEIKQEYNKRLKNLENLGGLDKFRQLSVLAYANCAGICNLDRKNKLSKVELQAAEECYKQCIKKQKEAKEELEKIEKKLKKEKQAYPEKCFQDAKQKYNQMIKMRKEMTQEMPKGHKLISEINKNNFIQSYANRCILIYGFTNYNCEKIKKYKKPYEDCKKLRQMQQDMDFIERWGHKTFDEYLKDKNLVY